MLEINNTVAEIKNALDCLINSLVTAKKGISELETSKTEMQKKNIMKKMEQKSKNYRTILKCET